MASTQRSGRASAETAISSRNMELNGLPMPPLQATSQDSTATSTSMWAKASPGRSSPGRRLRQVAYTLNRASAPIPPHSGQRGRAMPRGPSATSTVTAWPTIATQRRLHSVRRNDGVVVSRVFGIGTC